MMNTYCDFFFCGSFNEDKKCIRCTYSTVVVTTEHLLFDVEWIYLLISLFINSQKQTAVYILSVGIDDMVCSAFKLVKLKAM